jgi:hypothetical protein
MDSADYVEPAIRQSLTQQGKAWSGRLVFNITLLGTYNRTCDFRRIRLKQALRGGWFGAVPVCAR